MNTRDANPGDKLHIGPDRCVVVVENHHDGIDVIWFDHQGIGPHHARLPHAQTYQRLYENENVHRESYWETHPDFKA